MSMDRSLKIAGSLTRHRNVLTRAERLARLRDEDRWDEEQSVFGLVKVANRNLKVGKKQKDEEEEGEKVDASAEESTDSGDAKDAKKE